MLFNGMTTDSKQVDCLDSKLMQIISWFEDWFADQPCQYKPYVLPDSATEFVLRFEGIPHLSLRLSAKGDAVLSVYEGERYWDMIAEWDVFSAQTEEGRWFCSECNAFLQSRGETLKFWASEQVMWKEHVFDALVHWCEMNLHEENIFACWGIPEKTSHGVEIIHRDEVDCYKQKSQGKRCVFLPVVNPLFSLYQWSDED